MSRPPRGGARIVGKTRLDELCWSASGINHWAGTPDNPRDPRRLPGGSSSRVRGGRRHRRGGRGVRYRHRGLGQDPRGLLRGGRPQDRPPGCRSRVFTRSRRPWTPLGPCRGTSPRSSWACGCLSRGSRRSTDKPAGRRKDRDAGVDRRRRPGGRRGRRPRARGGGRRGNARPRWDADAALSAIGVLIDAEGFRSNAYLMPYLGSSARTSGATWSAAPGSPPPTGRTRSGRRRRCAPRFESAARRLPRARPSDAARLAAAARRARLPVERADRTGQPGRAARAEPCRCPRPAG